MTEAPGGNEKTGQAERSVEVRLLAWELRKQGYTYRQIAKALAEKLKKDRPLSTKTVMGYIAREYEERRTKLGETVEQVKALELERLDRYLTKLETAMASASTTAGQLKGLIDTAVRVQARRSALLGLDAPTKVDIHDKRGRPYEDKTLGQLETEMAETQAAIEAAERRREKVH